MSKRQLPDPTIGICSDFLSSSDSKPEHVTVIIGVTTVNEREDYTTGIGYSCSRGKQCFSDTCKYAWCGRAR